MMIFAGGLVGRLAFFWYEILVYDYDMLLKSLLRIISEMFARR